MTSLATNLALIDDGLLARYAGMTILAGSPRVSTAVEVFLEEPHNEVARERVFPSVSIILDDFFEDTERRDTSEEYKEEVSLNTGVSPYIRTMRLAPSPHRITYTVDTWHKIYVGEERSLLDVVFMQKTPPRGVMAVKNIDGQDITVEINRVGRIVRRVEGPEKDMIVYHRTATIEVLAHLSRVDADDTTDSTAVMTMRWKMYRQKFIQTPSGGEIVSGGDVLDTDFEFDDTTEGLS